MALANPPAVAPDQKGVMIADPSADAASKLERVLISGDLAQLTPDQRVFYYHEVCESAGLNPLTRPFDYLNLNGKLVLYANKSCTDQVRRVNRIEIVRLERERADDLAIVIAYARDGTGRQDSAMGAVSIAGLKGEALANALMKAETKAKRRVTLALSGLGLLDEIEVDTAPGAWRQEVDMATGELLAGGPSVATATGTLEERIAAQAAAVTTSAAPVATDTDQRPVQAAPTSGGTAPAAAAAPTPAPDADPPADGAGDAVTGDVIDGTAVEVTEPAIEGLSAGEFRQALGEAFISMSDAVKHVRATYGDKATVDNLTPAQRAETLAAMKAAPR